MPISIPDTLRVAPGTDTFEPLIIELMFDQPVDLAALTERLQAAVPDADVTVETAFGEARDQFFFATFSGAVSESREAEAFVFARTLRVEIDAKEANPVLTDSIYGAVAVGGADVEGALFSCKTPRNDQLPFGWVHPVIRTPQAWAQSRGDGVTVAVIDTGHSTHHELDGAIKHHGQANFVEGGSDASDRFSSFGMRHPGHGTLVASVVASRGDADMNGNVNAPGSITGAAPLAKILPIRAIKSVISFSQKTVPPAIAHAINQQADVIVMALGGPTRVSATERALRMAIQNGLVVVCAAGNCWPKVVFPAAYAANGLCTAVAALTQDLTPWDKTGRGPEVILSAPGENVWGAAKRKASDSDWGIKPSQGTTLATSLTAGVAALWVARHGGRAALKTRADAAGTTVQAMFVASVTNGLQKPPVWNGANNLGAGVLDAEKTLDAPLPASATGTEAVPDTALASTGVESTANILITHLANHHPDAVDEFDPALADYAGEILWLSNRTGARARAAETPGLEGVTESDPASPALVAALTNSPVLRATIGLR